MVTYHSDGVFDAPLDRVWKLLTEEHEPDNVGDIHKHIKGVRVLDDGPSYRIIEQTAEGPDGDFAFKLRFDFDPPKGFDMTWLTGPLAGSKATHTYEAMGDRTKVDVEGEFVAEGIPDEAILAMVEDVLDTQFEEDNEHLRTHP